MLAKPQVPGRSLPRVRQHLERSKLFGFLRRGLDIGGMACGGAMRQLAFQLA